MLGVVSMSGNTKRVERTCVCDCECVGLSPQISTPVIRPIESRLLVIVIAGGSGTRFEMQRSIWKAVADRQREFGVVVYLVRMVPTLEKGKVQMTDNLTIEIGGADGVIPACLISTVEGMRFVKEKKLKGWDAPYVLRTNLSSLWDFPLLLAWIKKLGQSQGLYAGVIGHHNGIDYGSGAGFILSPDLVEELIRRKGELNYALIDDVAVGDFFKGRTITRMARCDYFIQVRDLNSLESLLQSDCPADSYHWRIKAEGAPNQDVIVYSMWFMKQQSNK
jgi:hypothetical protein